MPTTRLLSSLAKRGSLHLVTHRVSSDLAEQPGVTVHRVRRPLGWHFLRGSLLSQAGRRTGKPSHAAVFERSSTAAIVPSESPTGCTTCTPRISLKRVGHSYEVRKPVSCASAIWRRSGSPYAKRRS